MTRLKNAALRRLSNVVLRDITPELIKMITRANTLSYDIESTGVNVRKDKIIGFSVSDGVESYYVVHQEWQNDKLVEVITFQRCQLLLNIIFDKRLIMHNAAFDCQITSNYFKIDLVPSLHADTMLMAHSLNENRFNYGLKELSAEIFGNDEKAEQSALKDHLKTQGAAAKEFYKADSSVLGSYAAKDALLTYRLYKYFLPQLHADGLKDFFFDDEVMPLLKHVSIPMMAKGIPLDVPYLQQTQTELAEIMEKLEAEIQAAIAPYLNDFNRWFIQKNYKFELNARFKQKLGEFMAPALWPRTETGQLSFSSADIKRAKEYTKTELKRGSTRPLLIADSQYEQIITGKIRCPADIVQKVQIALMAEDGLKYTFNLLSKDHMKRLFFGTTTTESVLNETPLSTTEKGNPQVDDEFLESIKGKYSWIPLWQRFNSLTKIKSTYVDRFLDEQENGIFYPSFYQHRTTSGRYSGDLQQLNRPMEEGEGDSVVREYNNRIRKFFISGPGKTFADFDYDSQEVKVFAHVSGEQSIKDVFANGEDFYSSVCLAAEHLQGYSANKKADNYLGKKNKPARQRAKAYALGLAFGMTAYMLKFELNCSEQEAQAIYDNYFRAYPKLKAWLDDSKRRACLEGYVRTQAGRIRRFPELKRYYAEYGDILFDPLELWKEYHEFPDIYEKLKKIAGICKNLVNNAANVQIQGLAASITNRAAIKTAKALKAANLQAYICAVTHDQITVLATDEHLAEASKIIQESMETAYPISVFLNAPPGSGKNLAESK